MVPATALYRTAFRYIYRHENCNVNSKMCNPIIDGYFQWEDRMQTRYTEKKNWAITKYDWAKTMLCRSVCCLHCVFCKTRTCPKCGKWHLKLLHLMFDSSRNISAWEGVPNMDKRSINCVMIVAARGRISTRDDGINDRVIFSVTLEGLKKKNNTWGINRTPPPPLPSTFDTIHQIDMIFGTRNELPLYFQLSVTTWCLISFHSNHS